MAPFFAARSVVAQSRRPTVLELQEASEAAVWEPKEGLNFGFLGWCGQVIAWTVIVAFTVAIALAVAVPRIGGATPYAILTGSMRPEMPPGTLVVMKPVPVDDIGIGSVVTYQLESGKPTVVTHRVVAVGFDGRGEKTFTTQGDANNVSDAEDVKPVQIKGALWYKAPYLGYVNKYITGKERHIIMIIVVSGLLLYAAFMFTSALRDRFGKSRHRQTADAS